jgi:hypothetical protein
MTALGLLLDRGGFAPRQLGLNDDVYDPGAPRGIPAKARLYGDHPREIRARDANPRANAGRAPGTPGRLWPLTDRQAEAQRQSERDLVRGAEREAAARRGDAA